MGKRTQFEEMVLCKALELKSASANSDVLDSMLAHNKEVEGLELKNVCAKVTIQLSDDLDNVCGLLSVSKRRFIESALIEALLQAKEIMYEDVDIFEHYGDGVQMTGVDADGVQILEQKAGK
jgi:hypothetical protein